MGGNSGISGNHTAEKERFRAACGEIIVGVREENSGIGTLSEKTLHAVLKRYFELDGGICEIKFGRYVADVVLGERGIFEIQTRAFNVLRKKLEAFLKIADVTVVYPIPYLKWLCWVDDATGETSPKRKSPKTGSVYDVFPELYKIKMLLDHPKLHLCLVLLEVTEYRFLNGWSEDKKKGSSRCERIPDDLLGEVYIQNADDYRKLIPEGLPAQFTAKDYAKAIKRNHRLAGTALNVLCHIGAVRHIGKKRNLYLYEVV
ncbi:MAG TPA: hypothetical protein PK629_08060 [Oscillospiraceae bacterium]|nr:hypothetical protein [Oscillospiraceae bacterium]HPF56270.1 hypothetical protein [Clostridiales bacterium]HPK35357.1 hypothetical protein [Oscillospiraceae bacterium]HPR76806.1 hypothetical protein [Oscillospiraceae bacterium]